jgi:hypothetical protein
MYFCVNNVLSISISQIHMLLLSSILTFFFYMGPYFAKWSGHTRSHSDNALWYSCFAKLLLNSNWADVLPYVRTVCYRISLMGITWRDVEESLPWNNWMQKILHQLTTATSPGRFTIRKFHRSSIICVVLFKRINVLLCMNWKWRNWSPKNCWACGCQWVIRRGRWGRRRVVKGPNKLASAASMWGKGTSRRWADRPSRPFSPSRASRVHLEV